MKWATVTLLIVLAFTVLTPLSSFSLFVAVEHGGEVFSNLDVCHSSTPALSSNGEMPCVPMTATGIIPAVFVTFNETAHPVFTELILTTRNEQPPQS
jgi:hypothetical protein